MNHLSSSGRNRKLDMSISVIGMIGYSVVLAASLLLHRLNIVISAVAIVLATEAVFRASNRDEVTIVTFCIHWCPVVCGTVTAFFLASTSQDLYFFLASWNATLCILAKKPIFVKARQPSHYWMLLPLAALVLTFVLGVLHYYMNS